MCLHRISIKKKICINNIGHSVYTNIVLLCNLRTGLPFWSRKYALNRDRGVCSQGRNGRRTIARL